MSFLKNNIYIIAGALIVVIICVLYFNEANRASATEAPSVEEGIVIYDAASALPDAPPSSFKVYISGEVLTPGVYEVENGARVERVVELAGGLTGKADPHAVNLAAYVSDAQHIVVPALGEEPASVDASAGGAPGISEDGTVNINTATLTELQTLPGIGETIAGYIIAYRVEQGGFKSIEEIVNVTRIGAVTFEKIKDKITV